MKEQIEKLKELREKTLKELKEREAESKECRYKLHYLDGQLETLDMVLKLFEPISET